MRTLLNAVVLRFGPDAFTISDRDGRPNDNGIHHREEPTTDSIIFGWLLYEVQLVPIGNYKFSPRFVFNVYSSHSIALAFIFPFKNNTHINCYFSYKISQFGSVHLLLFFCFFLLFTKQKILSQFSREIPRVCSLLFSIVAFESCFPQTHLTSNPAYVPAPPIYMI